MGSRKPIEFSTAHYTKAEIARKERESEAATTTRECFSNAPPDDLVDEVAVSEWNRVKDMLQDIMVIGDLDKAALTGYCNAYSLYTKATKELAASTLVVTTEKGIQKNPLVAIQDTYARQLRDFASKAGLSIDYRLKASALKIQKENAGITDTFGDI